MQSRDLKIEMRPIIDNFLANMTKTVKLMSKRHRHQRCQVMRAEKEHDKQAASAVNQYYEVLSVRDIRQDWNPRPVALQLDSDPTVWPFKSDTYRLDVSIKTYKTPTSPLRMKRKLGVYNFPHTLEPNVRVVEETHL